MLGLGKELQMSRQNKKGVGVSAAEHQGTVLRGIHEGCRRGETEILPDFRESVTDTYWSQCWGFICTAISFPKPNWKVCHILFNTGR